MDFDFRLIKIEQLNIIWTHFNQIHRDVCDLPLSQEIEKVISNINNLNAQHLKAGQYVLLDDLQFWGDIHQF